MGEPKINNDEAGVSVEKEKLDIHATKSTKTGIVGLLETLIRSYRTLMFSILMVPVYIISVGTMGVAIAPAIAFFEFIYPYTQTLNIYLKYPAVGILLSASYLVYGLSLCFVVPAVNFILPLRLKAWRGIWFSVQAIPWFMHNALTYIVRYTFLEFVTPSPLNILFYRMMGMKIGKGTVINTTNISDPCLISIGKHVTIGGSATLFGHYGQKGFLVLEPVVIGDGATIGLKASIMGGCRVGKKAVVLPHSALLPKGVVEDGEKF